MRALRAIDDPHRDARSEVYDLRTLGDEASRIHLQDGIPLTRAVVCAVRSSGKKLNNHHVQRIVEFANLKAFRELRGTSLGTDTKPVYFEGGPASTLEVLDEIRPKGSKEVKMASMQTPMRVDPDIIGRTRDFMEERLTKTAHREPVGDVDMTDAVDLYRQLGNAADQCNQEAAILTGRKEAALREIVRYADFELRNGASAGDIHRLLATVAGPGKGDYVKMAMEKISAASFNAVGLFGEDLAISMQKVSSDMPNERHPLFSLMQEYVKVAEACRIKKQAYSLLKSYRAQLAHAFRQAS